MASYKKLDRNNWSVTISRGYDEKGKRVRIYKQGFKTKREAELFVTETLDKEKKGYIINNDNSIKFKDFILSWFNEYKSNTLGVNTRSNYLSRINYHILPVLGNYKLSEITTIVIQNFYNDLINNKKLAPTSAKKIMEILNNCFKYAKKNKLIYVIPTDIEKAKLDRPKIEFWTKEEVDYFLNEIKETYLYGPVFIALLTGLRIGELCALKWKNIDFENNYLTVNSQILFDKATHQLILTSILKTSSSVRTITIPNVLKEFLEANRGLNKDNDFVIKSRTGEMANPRNISMEFTKKVAKYKLDHEDMKEKYPNKDLSKYKQLTQITFHSLRHTHATLLISNGENIKVVSDRLGHKDISITLNTYTHVMEDMKKETAALLDKIF